MRVNVTYAIYHKELVDMLRDRRTLISMILAPLVAIPGLFTVMAKVISRAEEKSGEESRVIAISQDLDQGFRNALEKAGLKPVPKSDLKAAVHGKSAAAAVESGSGSKGESELRLYFDRTNQSSGMAADKVRAALSDLKDERIRQSLAQAGVSANVLTPFAVRRVNIAPDKKMSGFIWGRILGYVVLLLMFTGGMYPAIDMTAGEKERRTLEVFLSSPATRREIVLGKILATMTAMIVTALLTMGSLVYSMRFGGLGRSKELKQMLGTAALDPGTLSLVLLTLLPMAVLGASVMIAIATFARGFKEGQSYLTPLVMLVVFPAAMGGLPGLDLTPALALIPVFNASQMIKHILLGEFSAQLFSITLAANLSYAALAFLIAVRIFEDESVLFRT